MANVHVLLVLLLPSGAALLLPSRSALLMPSSAAYLPRALSSRGIVVHATLSDEQKGALIEVAK